MSAGKISIIMGALLISGVCGAAEIYNKDGNKLDLYGSMRARHYFSDDTSVDGDNSYVRFGFRGQTQINDKLTGYGQWEYSIQANKAESEGTEGTKTRFGYAGLRYGDLGSLDYGRNAGVLYDVAGITDYAPIFDIMTDSYTDGFLTGRANGLLTWRNNTLFGLTDKVKFAVQYQGAEGDDSNSSGRSVYTTNGEGAGVSVSYDFDWDGTLLAAYGNSKRTAAQQALAYGDGEHAEMWAAGFKYNPGKFYAAIKYSQGKNITPIKNYGYANKTQNFEAYMRYVADSGVIPGIGWFQSKGKQIEGYGDVDLMKYLDVSVSYFFNKNFFTYADYKINQLNDDTPFGISGDDTFGVGMTYQF
ncbi:outer membrane pore protein E [Erwinia toletana]|uniref:Outer membrane pore protein E n=1 Tax=Winslowiella toletana TaxID=92490 RepID=A0ABS4PGP5_9GAMM|nr:porin OmpC [Winslowiella toletana]MBP2171281.1 outer membrane pore protein E [Winslowiella toletana]